MTLEEIRKYLDDTKVYVNGKSREIQEKLFTFGYEWDDCNPTKVNYEGSPFLFINSDREITYSNGMLYFKRHKNREISAEEILSIEITEPLYRLFESQEECFEEMKKHIPFGWLKSKQNGCLLYIGSVNKDSTITLSIEPNTDYSYTYIFEHYTFADGKPFGIKED